MIIFKTISNFKNKPFSKTDTLRTKKLWINSRELFKYCVLVAWIAWVPGVKKSEYRDFATRVDLLIQRSGSDFAFLYLKECLRLTTRRLAGYEKSLSQKIFVKIDASGWPTILPKSFRSYLCSIEHDITRSWRPIVGVLTLLSVFRVFPTSPKVKLDSITSKFSGLYKTFDLDVIRSCLRELGIENLDRLGNQRYIGSLTSGPNTKVSLLGCVQDAVAFLHSPLKLVTLWKLLNPFWRFALVIILVVWGPCYIFSRIIWKKSKCELGRLSVVYDQAGKARVVAITNWWIQLCLKPLHTSLFASLRNLPTDGTFDQEKPLNALLKRIPKGQILYGFDLSAATDRLPVELQVDILNILGFKGELWRNLLDINWFYDNNYVRYSVGQPMGAYSSWAMLAVSHHLIVKAAAQRSEISNFTDYAVLGDDIVIANDKVAESYLQIMKDLGVEINLSKSIVSTRFTEFAKKLKGKHIDISPLGPGLILQALRYRWSVLSLFLELLRRNIFNVPQLFNWLRSFPWDLGKYRNLLVSAVLWDREVWYQAAYDGNLPITPSLMTDTKLPFEIFLMPYYLEKVKKAQMKLLGDFYASIKALVPLERLVRKNVFYVRSLFIFDPSTLYRLKYCISLFRDYITLSFKLSDFQAATRWCLDSNKFKLAQVYIKEMEDSISIGSLLDFDQKIEIQKEQVKTLVEIGKLHSSWLDAVLELGPSFGSSKAAEDCDEILTEMEGYIKQSKPLTKVRKLVRNRKNKTNNKRNKSHK